MHVHIDDKENEKIRRERWSDERRRSVVNANRSDAQCCDMIVSAAKYFES